MTEVRTPTPAAGSPQLATLLVEVGDEPLELIDRLRAERERVMLANDLLRDSHRSELQFLLSADRRLRAPEVREAVEAADREALLFRRRCLAAAPDDDPVALFDLAELRAALRYRHLDDQAADVAADLERRLKSVRVDDQVVQEARERFAALSAEEEDLELGERSLVLEEAASLNRRLAESAGSRELGRLGRRLRWAADDAVLARRLHRVLTRRGAAALEIISLSMLMVLLALLLIESTVPLSTATQRLFSAIDIGVCLFFVAEFSFKLALATDRLSWFLRNALTDLLPALPAALLFLNVPNIPSPSDTFWVRMLRMLRVAYFARYIQALRPVLRLLRLLLFLVRGLDHLVHRFSWLMNRNFVFFDPDQQAAEPALADTDRSLVFRALRREHVLVADLAPAARAPVVAERARRLADLLGQADTVPVAARRRERRPTSREIPVEQAIRHLHSLRPEQMSQWMARNDVLALDRVARVINAPVVRVVPFIRRLASRKAPTTPEQRVVELGRRVADQLESWRDRALAFADLHGILTGPQILDRLSTALINASKRPAVRLLMFGGLFVMVRLVVGKESMAGRVLERFVATPLLVLGGVCMVVLATGRWLKRLAGEASETLTRTSEAHCLSLLELQKTRQEAHDRAFLARRVFRWEIEPDQAERALRDRLGAMRSGEASAAGAFPAALRGDANRVVLLYLHFLDGGPLHANDIQTSQQLLANLSLENIRNAHLMYTGRDRKRLRRLSLDRGGLFSGPYLWFRCITESVALETAKRVVEYNRHCLTLRQREVAPVAVRQAMEAWLAKREADIHGRSLEAVAPPGEGAVYATTEFNALDFMTADPDREAQLARVFGDQVVKVLRHDRRELIREIFGTRRLDLLPRTQRTINFHALYMRRLSRGRVLLLPVVWVVVLFRGLRMIIAKTIEIVREILSPAWARRAHQSGAAPFAVALRKIHRMKAPGLLETMTMRAAFDPAYCGASPTWTGHTPHEECPEMERDMDFLDLRERDREALRDLAAQMRRRAEDVHFRMHGLPDFGDGEPLDRRLGERAVTIAFATDRERLRTLLRAEDWFERALLSFEAKETRVRASRVGALLAWLRRCGRRHPVTRWLRDHLAERRVSRRARRNFKRAYQTRDSVTRRSVDAWFELEITTGPTQRGLEIARAVYRNHAEVSRELAALRTVQSLAVLDVRHYRKLVFEVGGYAEDGEDPGQALAVP
ncbi:MAG: hypothetical protein AAF628_05095 [Planctomycetota bacterium]